MRRQTSDGKERETAMEPRTQTATTTIDTGDLRAELLGRLGLPADASGADVRAAHRAATSLLENAPDDQRSWAQEQLADVEAVISLLDDLPPAATAAAPAVRASRRRTPWFVWAAGGAVLVVGAAFGIHSMSSASVPGIDGAPTNVPSASASTLDMAKVSALMQKITSNPKDTASLQGLASLYFQAGDYKNSAVFSQKVVTLDPKNDLSWVALGAAQFNQGQNDAAKASWVKATFLNPKNAEAHYDLGFYYLSGSKPDQAAAKKEWAAVIAIDPKSDLAKTVQTHMASLASAAPSAK